MPADVNQMSPANQMSNPVLSAMSQTSAMSVPATAAGDTTASGVATLAALLTQLADVVATTDPGAYVARPAAAVSGSVGEHVRHLLDHVAALTDAVPGDTLSYDHRDRGTVVERHTAAALHEIARLQRRLAAWREELAVPMPMEVVTRLTPAGDSVIAWSTSTRELAFVINHTIHHQALIAVLLAWQGVRVPPRFGVAPSTPDPR